MIPICYRPGTKTYAAVVGPVTAQARILATYQAAKFVSAEGKANTVYSHQGTRTVVTSSVKGTLELRYVPRDPRITHVNTSS